MSRPGKDEELPRHVIVAIQFAYDYMPEVPLALIAQTYDTNTSRVITIGKRLGPYAPPNGDPIPPDAIKRAQNTSAKGLTQEDKDAIKRALKAGVPIPTIMERYNISKGRVWQIEHDYDAIATKKRRDAREQAGRKDPKPHNDPDA